MAKTFPASQVPLIERPHASPLYFIHLYLPGETLYFSDRNFKFNGHDYEAYVFNIPELVHSIEQLGGYLNIDAELSFWNKRFRSYNRLIDFFVANPLTRREMDLFVLYLDNGQIPETDVSTKLHKLSFTELRKIGLQSFSIGLSSILHAIDKRKLFIQINRTNWPEAAPGEIGKYENCCFGAIKDMPCHCVKTGAISTLAQDVAANATEIYLSETDYPIPFPSSGTVQLGIGLITYTGKDSVNKKLTGCSWSVPARSKKRGEPIWQIIAQYKFLIDGGSVKSAANVKVAGTKVPDTDRTINLNESGKSVITFTQRNLLQNQGAHTHDGAIEETFYPTGSTFTYSPTMGAQGAAANLRDKNLDTFCSVGVTGTTDGAKIADFTVTFPVYTGAVPDRVYACINCSSSLGIYCGEYFRVVTPQTIAIGITGYSQPKETKRFLLSGTSVPTTLRVRAYTGQGTPTYPCYLAASVFEMWLELEFDNVPSGGESAIWSKLAPLVTCDVEGYSDDGSGTYTGTPNALIENPSDIRRFILVGLLGRSMSEIGDSFAAERSRYANRVPGVGYKFGMNLLAIGKTPEEIFKNLDEQSASQMREDGGKFELDFKLDSFTSQYPAQDDAHVKATTKYSTAFWPYYTTDPAKSLTGEANGNQWDSANGAPANQRFHIDLGEAKVIRRIYYENSHHSGTLTTAGARNFSFWGSNSPADFADLVYANDGSWTELSVSQNAFDQHVALNQADPKYIDVTNDTAYRYYAFKFADNWGGSNYMAIRRIDLQTLDQTDTTPVLTIDDTIYIDEPVFSETPAVEIANLIRAVYNRDWSGSVIGGKFGQYLDQVEAKDDPSIADLGELPEDIEFPGIQSQAMAQDVADWRLARKKGVLLKVSLICRPIVRKLERGDLFILNDVAVAAWEGLTWRVLGIKEVPNRQAFSIRAIQYISS